MPHDLTNHHLNKWALRDLGISILFVVLAILLLPSTFYADDNQFRALLSGLAAGIGFARLLRLAQLAQSGSAAQPLPPPDNV